MSFVRIRQLIDTRRRKLDIACGDFLQSRRAGRDTHLTEGRRTVWAAVDTEYFPPYASNYC